MENRLKMSNFRVALALAASAAALLAGCSQNTQKDTGEGASPAPAQPAPAERAEGGAALPPGHPPVGGGMQQPQLSPPPEGAGSGEHGISWKAPQGWTVEVPSSQMRKAQYRVPGPGGDGECVVFYFGPNEGGDTLANVQRWASQFPKADGSPAEYRMTEVQVGAIPVTMVEIDGTFAGGMGSASPDTPRENYKLLGAVAKGPDANWFFKFTGPKATVEQQRGAFETLVKSLKSGA